MKYRAVNVSERRAAQRLLDLFNQALIEAKIDLAEDERARLWAEVVRLATEDGWALTRQVR